MENPITKAFIKWNGKTRLPIPGPLKPEYEAFDAGYHAGFLAATEAVKAEIQRIRPQGDYRYMDDGDRGKDSMTDDMVEAINKLTPDKVA